MTCLPFTEKYIQRLAGEVNRKSFFYSVDRNASGGKRQYSFSNRNTCAIYPVMRENTIISSTIYNKYMYRTKSKAYKPKML